MGRIRSVFGEEKAKGGVVPAHERLEPDDLSPRDVDLRLVFEAQLIARPERTSKVFDERQPIRRPVPECPGEVLVGVAPRGLRLVHRCVGALHQLVDRGAIEWI